MLKKKRKISIIAMLTLIFIFSIIPNKFVHAIENPRVSKMNIENFEVNGDTLNVRGWVLHENEILSISAYLGYENIGDIELNKKRPDVDRTFPGYANGENSGFEKSFNISKIPQGEQILKIIGWGLDGSKIYEKRKVSIKRKSNKMNLEFPKNYDTIEGNTLKVRGWAIGGSPITQVKVLIDNEQIGIANYGEKRPDVNSAFPGYGNGEDCGFNGEFDLSYVTSGKKRLTIETTSIDGKNNFTNINVNINKKPAKINLENPKWGDSINSGIIDVRGWALNGSGVRWVKIYVDDKLVGDANLDINRADVNKVFPGYPNGDKSGFNKKIKVDDIGVGKKVIKAEAIGWDGSKVDMTSTINITKKVAIMNLEEPTNNSTSNGAKVNVRGWALSDSGIKEVKLYVDDKFVGNAELKQNRPDVARVFSAYKNGKDSGFTGELNVAKFSEGNHKVKAEAIGNDGTSTSMEKVVKLNKKVVVIDPSYNIKSKNNINLGDVFTYNGKQFKESEINMQLALNLKDKLTKLGYKVVLTQEPNEENNVKSEAEDTYRRLNIIKNANADMFINIECGKNKDKNVKGTKAIFNGYKDNIITENNIRKSSKLANNLFDSVIPLGFSDAGISNMNYFLLRTVNIPAAIIEPGFLSNQYDIEILTDKDKQIKIATKMAEAIDRSFKQF